MRSMDPHDPTSIAYPGGVPLEQAPLTRPEYINAMVHFYRGEMHRAQVWRARLDTTTNWAVLTVAGMTTFAFGDPGHSHFILLLSTLPVTAFLVLEARRFRYFSVYRARVRMLEENFFIPIIRRNLVSPRDDWRESVAADLDAPKFKATMRQAVAFRLRRNYLWIYGVLLASWVVKLFLHPTPAIHWSEIYERAGVGPIPGVMVFLVWVALIAAITALMMTTLDEQAAADEIRGESRDMEHWKV